MRRRGCHLEKHVWRLNSTSSTLIWMKFGVPVQNHMLMTMKWSEWEPELEIQYGGCSFSETGSS